MSIPWQHTKKVHQYGTKKTLKKIDGHISFPICEKHHNKSSGVTPNENNDFHQVEKLHTRKLGASTKTTCHIRMSLGAFKIPRPTNVEICGTPIHYSQETKT